LASKVSGVSLLPDNRATTAFTKTGDSGGQSTGAVCQSEDRRKGFSDTPSNRLIACRMFSWASPRFAPKAMIAHLSTLDVRLWTLDFT
jgi:hypothetical protein